MKFTVDLQGISFKGVVVDGVKVGLEYEAQETKDMLVHILPALKETFDAFLAYDREQAEERRKHELTLRDRGAAEGLL